MLIRCKQCHGSVQLQSGEDLRATCPTCDQRYLLKGSLSTAKAEKLFAKAHKIAAEHEIDLPGAYSIALGIMSLEDVQALSQQPAVIVTSDEDEEGLDFDPTFKESVETGALSVREARERGQRAAFAQRLVDRHKLSMESALAVADNRTSLLAAIRARKRDNAAAEQVVESPRSRFPRIAMAGVVLVVTLAGIYWSGLATVNSVKTTFNEPAVKIRTDDHGQILQIDGPDAVSVLDAYCGSGEKVDRRECLGLRHSPRDGERVMLGVFRKRAEPELEYAIYISRHRAGTRWRAGNGRFPLSPFLAPSDRSELDDAVSAEQ
jgi:hypothetical protein